jgi:hypothetical protein
LARQLVISGMHRSGTSLVASALRKAGVDLGQQMIGARRGNVHGHFEDWDFHRIHENMLAACGQTAFSADRDLSTAVDERFLQAADALIAARAGREPWGFKNPRTCLFLSFWERVLPEANWLFVYRHPADVALSLWRRDADPEIRQDRWLAIRSWQMHNRRLLDFVARHRQRCFLAHGDACAGGLPALVREVGGRFDLALSDKGVDELFVPAAWTPTLRDANDGWHPAIASALDLFRQLEAVADLPAPLARAGVAAAPPESAVREPDERSRLLEILRQGPQEAENGGTKSAGPLAEPVIPQAAAESLVGQLIAADARGDALAAALTAIEGSRSYAVVKAWWRIRQMLRWGRPKLVARSSPARANSRRGEQPGGC